MIKTLMTRCIHCTRCVRFLNLVSSDEDFNLLGRGKSVELVHIFINIFIMNYPLYY